MSINWRLLFRVLLFCISACIFSKFCDASAGTDSASFLNIPVGAGPAALGGSYTARATNIYAPIWNPGGLGFIHAPEIAGQHLSYVESINDEYVGFVVPFRRTSALGGSVQYLTSGQVTGRDDNGNLTGDFSNSYAAYSLAYGQALTSRWSLGITGKWIHAKLSDVTANAYAGDIGTLYQLTDHFTLAGTITNLGSDLAFINQPDALPSAAHGSIFYHPNVYWNISLEGIYERTGLASFHTGLEWKPLSFLTLRSGYRTDTIKNLSLLAGVTTGFGLHLWGSELAYAWVPLGDLGDTQYLSFVLKFESATNQKRNLVQFKDIQRYSDNKKIPNPYLQEDGQDPNSDELMNLLSESNSTHVTLSQSEKAP